MYYIVQQLRDAVDSRELLLSLHPNHTSKGVWQSGSQVHDVVQVMLCDG